MKLILGLTGAYCSGKNTVARILETRGWYCIDVDKLGHEALKRAASPVRDLLGGDALKEDGTPDRRAIAGKVFGNPEALARYEAIVHPIMLSLLDEAIERSPRDLVCVNAAILYRLPQAMRTHGILEVTSPLFLRLLRGIRRDRQPLCIILKKISAQRKLFANKPQGIPIARVANCSLPPQLERKVLEALKKLGL